MWLGWGRFLSSHFGRLHYTCRSNSVVRILQLFVWYETCVQYPNSHICAHCCYLMGRWWQWCLWGFGKIFLYCITADDDYDDCWLWVILADYDYEDFQTLPSTGLTWALNTVHWTNPCKWWNTQSLTLIGTFSMMIVRILIGFDLGRFRRRKNRI